MGASYFFSDVHLGMSSGAGEKKRVDRLLGFLDYLSGNADRIYIVGDLFDFWFEYRTVIPRGYMRVLSALTQLKGVGKEIHYIAGNHDFWMQDFLTSELNIQIHFDALECEIDDRRFYIHHGDGIARDDGGYRVMKRIFRNRFNIFLYSLLHPDLGIPLAKWVSNLSRSHQSNNGTPDDTDYREEAHRLFQDGFDYVIFGHLHHPVIQPFGEKAYVNLGDWIEHFSYAVFDGYDLRLLKWER